MGPDLWRSPGPQEDPARDVGVSSPTRCPMCGADFASLLLAAHHGSGCLLGLLLGVLQERGEIRFGDPELLRLAESRFGVEWLWDGFGAPAADALEDLLLDCGAETKGDQT